MIGLCDNLTFFLSNLVERIVIVTANNVQGFKIALYILICEDLNFNQNYNRQNGFSHLVCFRNRSKLPLIHWSFIISMYFCQSMLSTKNTLNLHCVIIIVILYILNEWFNLEWFNLENSKCNSPRYVNYMQGLLWLSW